MQHGRPRKLQRISQACDLCHRRSIRCRPSNEDGERCQNCYDFDVACTYDRPSKRRKHPQAPAAPQQQQPLTPASSSSAKAAQAPQDNSYDGNGNLDMPSARMDSLLDRRQTGKSVDRQLNARSRTSDCDELEPSWEAFALASERVMLELFDIYMEIVYPLYPVFHGPTDRRRIQVHDHLTDRGFYASIMAACALAAARVRDGALPVKVSDAIMQPAHSSEIFFQAAKSAFASDLNKMHGVDSIRACTLLALTSIQYGKASDVQQYLGRAFTIAAMHRFYDEKQWASGMTNTQMELYRRIFWTTYSLDVYSAVVWNCFLRSQELHVNVRYPDNRAEDTILIHEPGPNQGVSWLTGWNFQTDLYRILEHTLSKARAKKFQHEDRRSVDSLVFQETLNEEDVMVSVLNMYYELPHIFKETPPSTEDRSMDIFALQAANIQATLQLLRMLLFSMEDGPGVERRCDVAHEVLSVFHTIPVRYVRVLSTPLVYQLGCIGQILGSVLDEPLSQAVYERVRTALVLMADLLDILESVLLRSAGAGQGLRKQVEKIDEYMRMRLNPPHAMPMHPSNQPHPIGVVNMVTGNHHMHGIDGDMSQILLPTELNADWPWAYFHGDGEFYPYFAQS